MKLFIKQRVFSWKQKFDIRDEKGDIQYYCESELITISKKLHIFNNKMQEVAYIKQELFHFLPHYQIYINGSYITTLVKKFTFFTHNYYYTDFNWKIAGDYFAHNYLISDNNKPIMRLSKKWLTWGDTYMLDIADDKNELLCLASAIVIDCVCHSGSSD